MLSRGRKERERRQQVYNWKPQRGVKENHGSEKVMSPMGKSRTHTEHHGLPQKRVFNIDFLKNTLEHTAAISSNSWR